MTADLVFDLHHESGHAVVAHVLGVPIRRVTRHGVWTRTRPGCARDQANSAIVAFSGPLAEDKHRRYSAEVHRQLWLSNVWAGDLANAVRYLAGGDAAQALQQARRLVDENWTSIEVLAAALRARETLTGDEVAALLEPSGPIH